MKALLLLGALMLGAGGPAFAKGAASSGLLPGANSNAPVNVNADKLEYFSKQSKAVYTGHVVARQGDGSLRASQLTIFFTNEQTAGAGLPVAGGAAGSQVRRMEAAGPVTVIQKDQIGTGDNGVYERAQNKIFLYGHVTLTQGPDVVKGDQLIYDLGTGQAQVVGRVTSLFLPGDGGPGLAGEKGKRSESNEKKKRAPRDSARAGEGGIP